MAGMNPEFNVQGTSTVEKRDRAAQILKARVEGFKLVTGVSEFSDAMLKAAQDVAEAQMYLTHFQKQVERAEAERKTREEAARKAEETRKTLEALARQYGGDMDKVLAAIRGLAEQKPAE